MVNINKKYFEQNIKDAIRRSFIKELKNIKTEKELVEITGRILTPAEQIMIEKRLAILHLLKRGLTYREIGNILDVTSHTISFVKRGFIKRERKRRQYSDWPTNKKKYSNSKFPTYAGKGRWRFLDAY